MLLELNSHLQPAVFQSHQSLYSPPRPCLCLFSCCRWRGLILLHFGDSALSQATSSSLDRSSPPAPAQFLLSSFRNLSLPFTVGKIPTWANQRPEPVWPRGLAPVWFVGAPIPGAVGSAFPAPRPDGSHNLPGGQMCHVGRQLSACQLCRLPQACGSPLRAFNYL